jgi:hypothetical protein
VRENMAIIISKNGKNAQRIEKSSFEQEDYLQKYIHENPESLPLYDIKEDIKLLIVAREFPTNSGPIDALGFDKDGEVYIIETKLYKNPDKRLVVAQVLDYGASLWNSYGDFNEFLSAIDDEINKKFDVSLKNKLEEFFVIGSEDVSSLVENVKRNLNDGNFRFVVLMDKLHDKLKDLIVFINQNSRFDIFGVELEYYKYKEYEIMIPKLFGSEVKKEVGSASKRKTWDWDSFSQQRLKNFGDGVVRAARSIIDFAEKNDIEIGWSGSKRGSFFPYIYSESEGKYFYPFAIQGDGKIGWNAPHQGDKAPAPFNKPEKRKEILTRMNEIKGAKVYPDKVNGFSALNFPIKSLMNEKARNEFFGILLWIKETLE